MIWNLYILLICFNKKKESERNENVINYMLNVIELEKIKQKGDNVL